MHKIPKPFYTNSNPNMIRQERYIYVDVDVDGVCIKLFVCHSLNLPEKLLAWLREREIACVSGGSIVYAAKKKS